METKWQVAHRQLKEKDMVRMHLDVPNKLRYELRLAAAQDGRKLRDVYIEALTDYIKDRKIQRSIDPVRNNELKLDLEDLDLL